MLAFAPERGDGQRDAMLDIDDGIAAIRDDRACVLRPLELQDRRPGVALQHGVGGDVRRLLTVLEALQFGIERRLHELRRAFGLHGREIGVGRRDELGARVAFIRRHRPREDVGQRRQSLGRKPALIADTRDDRLDLRDASVHDLEPHERLRGAFVFFQRRERRRTTARGIEDVVAIGERGAGGFPEAFAELEHAAVLRVFHGRRDRQPFGVASRERSEVAVDEALEAGAIARRGALRVRVECEASGGKRAAEQQSV